MSQLSAVSRLNYFSKADRSLPECYDLVVIGAGITGAGIAMESSKLGKKTLVLDQHDFAWGSSSASSKFIHGGLRYLEQREWKLIYEGLRERAKLLQSSPELVWPLQFLIPVYKSSRRPLWQIYLGCMLYYFLAGTRSLARPKLINAHNVRVYAPGLSKRDLKGGVLYQDAATIDAALVLASLNVAAYHGCDLLNHTCIESIQNAPNSPKITLQIKDKLSSIVCSIQTKKIALACGAYTNEVISEYFQSARPLPLRPSKGAHLVYPLTDNHPKIALLTEHPTDQRVTFIYPWQGKLLVGTTDTDCKDTTKGQDVSLEDRAYLQALYDHHFPNEPQNPVSAFAGLRPLVSNSTTQNASAVSRDFLIHDIQDNVTAIVGGKLTSYQHMAHELLKHCYPQLQSQISNLVPSKLELPKSFHAFHHEHDLEKALHQAYSGEMCVNAHDFVYRRLLLHTIAPEKMGAVMQKATSFYKDKPGPKVGNLTPS